MLHRLWPWPRRTYPDARLALLARRSVADDSLLADVTCVSITSRHGVLRLKGCVPHTRDKARIEADIRTALATAGLPYASLVNALQSSAAGGRPARAERPEPLLSLLSAR
jgi:hypothetical protein